MKLRPKSVVPPAEFYEGPRRPKYVREPELDQPPQLSSEHEKRLRTLARYYGRDQIIQMASTIAVSRKHKLLQAGKPAHLSVQGAKRLRTLVRKYRRDRISHFVSEIDLNPQRGRPPRGDLPYFERIHFAQSVEEEAEELHQAGSKSAIKGALYAVCEMDIGELKEVERRDPGRFNKRLKTHKKKWHRGKRELEDLRERQKLFDEMRDAQKQAHNNKPDE